jgi:hypothetical protein
MDDSTSKLLLIQDTPVYQEYIKHIANIGASQEIRFDSEKKPFIVKGQSPEDTNMVDVFSLPFYEYVESTVREKTTKKNEISKRLHFYRNKLIYDDKIDEDVKFRYENLLKSYERVVREIESFKQYQNHHTSLIEQKEDESKNRAKEFGKKLETISSSVPFNKSEYIKTLSHMKDAHDDSNKENDTLYWRDIYIKALPISKTERVIIEDKPQLIQKKVKRAYKKREKQENEGEKKAKRAYKKKEKPLIEGEVKPKRVYKRKPKNEMKAGKPNSILKTELKNAFMSDSKKIDEMKKVETQPYKTILPW